MTNRVLECEFPLRPNFTATLWLPRDLTAREVERLTAMLQTLVVDPEDEADMRRGLDALASYQDARSGAGK